MTNEELMVRLVEGDESVLMTLYVNNRGLIHDRARRMAEAYHCVRTNDRGQWSRYTKETLSELESVGILAFLECVRSGKYDSAQGALTTFVVPFIDGAMRRHFEKNLGTLSLDRDSMALVRRAQRLHDGQGKDVEEVAKRLGISDSEAAKHIAYATHFLSVYDLADWDEDNEVFDYIAEDRANVPPAETVYRRVQMECLRELFHRLPKKDRDILGKCFGAFGYPKTPLREIAMYHLIKEDAVEKAKDRVLKKLRREWRYSLARRWSEAHRIIEQADPSEGPSPLAYPAWWERGAEGELSTFCEEMKGN